MATLGNSKSLKFSKYFPNHLEYASRVYKDNLKNRVLKKKLKPKPVPDSEPSSIIDPTELEVTLSEQSEDTEEADVLMETPQKPKLEHPEVKIDSADILETLTRNYEKSVQDIGTQTEKEIDPDNQKDVLMETPQKPKLEQSTTPPPEQSNIDNPDFPIDPPKIWNDLRSFGEPRIIVSVIGAYNECTPTYELTDYLLLQNALNHVGKYAGRCGFIYQEEVTNIVQSVVSKCCHIESLPYTYGFFAVHLFEDAKEVTEEDAKEVTENREQHTHDTSCNLKQIKALLEIENYINSKEKVCFEDVQQESDMPSKIRVPVALLVLNGDLDTIEHVLRAIYSDMSVVVVKGTGGAADLIALCLEDFTKLKRELPIMFARRFNLFLFNKIQEVMELIVQKEWMISVFDIKVDKHDTLWVRITDGILRAWSFEEKHEKEILETEYFPMIGGEYISKYVADIDGLARRELFAGYSLNIALTQENKEENHQNVFVTSFICEKTDILEQILNNNETFVLSKKKFGNLWKQVINSIRVTSYLPLLQSLCSFDIKDIKALKVISEKLLSGLCCSKVGIITCCKCKREKSEEVRSVPTIEVLRLAVLGNRKKIAALLWHHCDNPIMTALISSIYLTALANTAEQRFDEKEQEELQNHADLFLSRALQLLEKMFADNERLAIDALDYVSKVWGHNESPLHFGHQFNVEEFISHSSNQKDASKRLFSYNITEEENTKSEDNPDGRNSKSTKLQIKKTDTASGFFPFIEHHWNRSKLSIFTSPVSMMVFHIGFFTAALIMFSLLLTLHLQTDAISLSEGLLFIYMVGDFLEEIWSMLRPEKDCSWSPQRILLHLLNIWNIMDLLCFVLYILGFCMHILDSNLHMHIRRIYSIALFVMFLRLLNFLLLFKRFGIIIIMVKEMLVDLLDYLVILIIFILAAGVVYHANVYPSHTVTGSSDIEFWRIWTILKIPYWQVYGELYLDTLEASDNSDCTNNATLWTNDPSLERCPTADWITPVIAAFYMMLTNWLLLNIVIAMFSSRFERIQQKSEQKWRYYRHSVVIDYEHRIPSPLNFPFRILSVINYTTKHECCPCLKKKVQGNMENMLRKQRQFAKEIIEEEKHRNTK